MKMRIIAMLILVAVASPALAEDAAQMLVKPPAKQETTPLTTADTKTTDTKADTKVDTKASPTDSANQPATATAKPVIDNGINITEALAERSIGAENAPVKIIEYYSLSCGHCAMFHKQTLPLLKLEYVDKGLLKITFRDYPLNEPALRAAQLARCLPAAQFPAFTSLLFEHQDDWAASMDFRTRLSRFGLEAGLDDKKIVACLDSKKLEEGIVTSRFEGGKQWGLQSTPTFIFPESGEKIQGSQDVQIFRDAINRRLNATGISVPESPGLNSIPVTSPVVIK
ncbi:MAG: thioredoxin domain-containing protein [Alphaproteobacteria bacterium]